MARRCSKLLVRTPLSQPFRRASRSSLPQFIAAIGLCTLAGLSACGPAPERGESEQDERPVRDEGSQAAKRDGGPRRVEAGAPVADAGRDSGVADSDTNIAPDAEPSTDAGRASKPPPHQGAPTLCQRSREDAVRDIFCGERAPEIRSLADLQNGLGFGELITPPDITAAELEELLRQETLTDGLVALGHSTALAGHSVSPINPRALLLGQQAIMAFQRGVQKIELISRDRESGTLNFYLVEFTQRCNERPAGCLPGDLYTPSIERDWLEVAVRDDEDLKNTTQDCRQCHQRGLDEPMLLIREINGQWSHFFAQYPIDAPPNPGPGENGSDLVQDFLNAKADEPYGNIPAFMFRLTSGFTLQNLAGVRQPLLFHANDIEEERWPFGPDGYAKSPVRSASWDRAYEAFQRGEQLALPHYQVRPTDPVKQAKLTDAYSRYRAGELAPEELPDLADVFPDDPVLRAEIGLQTVPGASAPELLVQACGACHNDVLDQTISRARFSVALSRMDRSELDVAIARLELAKSTAGVMPPPEARQLDEEGRKKLIAYLRENVRSSEDDAFLNRAAELGMRGGGQL